MPRTRICDACDGMTYIIIDGKKVNCSNCMGSGYVPVDQPRVKKK